MASKLAEDPRIDPRLKAVFGSLGVLTATGDVAAARICWPRRIPKPAKRRLRLLKQCSTPLTMKQSHHWLD